MKTVLSVRDFVLLYNIATVEISKLENNARNHLGFRPFTNEQIAKNFEDLNMNPYYQDLLSIRDKLGELNIEVETPSVEVEE